MPEAGQDILTLDERFFARIALKNGLLSETDLALATRDRVATGRPLAQILKARGLLTDPQIAKVREAQVASQVVRLDSLYADILVARGLVPRPTIEGAFHEQRRRRFKTRIGDLLVEKGVLKLPTHRAVLSELLRRLEEDRGPAGSTAEARALPAETVDRSGRGSSAPPPPPPTAPPPVPATPVPMTPARPAGDRSAAGSSRSSLHPSLVSENLPPEKPAGVTIPLTDSGDEKSDSKADAPTRADSHPETRSSGSSRARIPGTGERPASFLEENARALGVDKNAPRMPPVLGDGEASSKLLASALELRMSSDDEGPLLLSEEDKKLVALDRARLESVNDDSPVLQKHGQTSTDADGRESFKPELYVEARRRRRRLLQIAAGALALVGSVALGIEVFAIHGRQSALKQANELLQEAAAATLQLQPERFQKARERLLAAKGLGVSESERGRLDRKAVVGEKAARAQLALDANDPTSAQALLRDVMADPQLAVDERATLEVLRARADRDALVLEGKKFEQQRDWVHAVKNYKDANEDASCQRIKRAMADEIRATGQKALDSLVPDDRDLLVNQLKVFFELWNDGSLQPLIDDVKFKTAITRARDALRRDDAETAILRAQEALAIRDGNHDAKEILVQARRRATLATLLQRAADAERERRYGDATQALEEARESARGKDLADIEAALERIKSLHRTADLELDRIGVRREALELIQKSDWDKLLALKPKLDKSQDPLGPKIAEFATRARGMVLVKAGPFIMGSEGEKEKILPRTTVNQPAFLLDRLEVSNRDYFRFYHEKARTAPSHWRENVRREDKPEQLPNGEYVKTFSSQDAEHPVRFVTWVDASDYATWLGKRLPTEAEWEKAARGSDARTFPWGELPLPKHVRLNMDPTIETAVCGASEDDVSPFGIHDMAGNVCEWVADVWKGTDGKGRKRVIRGGSFETDVKVGRTFAREAAEETQALKDVGFRCALDVPAWVSELGK